MATDHDRAPSDPMTQRFLSPITMPHSGLVFHPRLALLGPRLAPWLHERASHTLPLLYAVWLGPIHFGELARSNTEFLCLECLGSKTLAVLEGEGMLRMRDYPPHMREALARAAAAAGVTIARGARTAAATDALIALRAGFPVVTLASLEQTKLPSNYHWPSDTPDGLRWQTIEDAIATCESFIRMRAAQFQRRRSWNGTPMRSS